MTDYQALPKEFISPKPATEATKKINPVSYTHLTLPTIYSV